ncbi:MAG TPA: hypothetical protein VIX12_01135, partial [Candidatus Binataceae bacterium]
RYASPLYRVGRDRKRKMAMSEKLYLEEMFAFVSEDDHGEGLACLDDPASGMMVPMVGADREMMDYLREMAKAIAQSRGVAVKLVKFSKREELEVIIPTRIVEN